jgi:hypothetical protein
MVLLAICIAHSAAPPARASDSWVPDAAASVKGTQVYSAEAGAHNEGASTDASIYPLVLLIRFYRAFISPAVASSCTFVPSCSAYGLQAFQKHGTLLGSVMTVERIMRNHQIDADQYSLVQTDGGIYQWDPVEANDFWFDTEGTVPLERDASECP